MGKDSELLKGAFVSACDKLRGYVENGITDEEELQAKITVQTVSTYSRLKAVENNEMTVGLNVARVMANNTDELKEYIRKSLPEFSGEFVKKLES